MASYRDLIVWRRAMDVVVHVYGFARTLPPQERFGACSQLQRAAVSIPANLAEGYSRRSDGAFLNHIAIAIGSQAELETVLEVCRRLGAGDHNLLELCEKAVFETGRMLYGLHASVQRSRAQKRGLLYSMILVASGLVSLASGLW